MQDDTTRPLTAALLELDKERTLEAAKAVLAGGAAAASGGVDALSAGLDEVGRRFRDGEWFLGELVYAGEIAKEVLALLLPHLGGDAGPRLGTVVVGTVKGDMHDLGKNIFSTYAQGAGFQVVDLGVDVPPERFVEAVREHRPLALGLSCLLTVSAGAVGGVIAALRRAELDSDPKVIVGGAALTQTFAREAGAHAFAPDAVTGTRILRDWSRS